MKVAWILGAIAICGLPHTLGAQASADTVAWHVGFELGRTPSVLLRWETGVGSWRFGGLGGLGPGNEDVRLRATPVLRVGRRLPGGVHLGGGLGFEWVWLARATNDREMELQWELTAGWKWRRRLYAEAGVRWTDYRVVRREGLLRVSLAHPTVTDPPPRMELPKPVPDFGVPWTLVPRARIAPTLASPPPTGRGILLTAANPGGDPDPWNGERAGPNVDRLGLGAQAWLEEGPWKGWLRWRSDLHTDASTRDRIDPIAEGLSFPVSVSLGGGVRWEPDSAHMARLDARFDPQAFLWLPHLGAERTAELRLAEGRMRHGALGFDFRSLQLDPIAGRSVDPLSHARGTVEVGRSTTLGAEHERLALGSDVLTRSRLITGARLDGAYGSLRARLAAGHDLTARVSVEGAVRGWHADATVAYRSEPELLDYNALLARGWLDGDRTAPTADPGSVIEAEASVGTGSLELDAKGTWGTPIWVPVPYRSIEREGGGYVDLKWAGDFLASRIEGQARARLAEWGSPFAWWRERSGVEGSVRMVFLDEIVRLAGILTARSRLRSARSSLEEEGGAEVTLSLSGPLPNVGPFRGMMARARLEDLFDAGLASRIGAPRRGRRLGITLMLASGGPR
ncbi:MAG: hypothetical protein U5R14_02450 [Gemmatimonadota bacterium]|nr:hypothetical protein [Gemmatimonadota bacterium]